MQTREYLNIGLKLIGVYFAVLGVIVLTMLLVSFAVEIVENLIERDGLSSVVIGPGVTLFQLLQPGVYLVCAFLLTRKTEWCLGQIGYPPPDA